MYYRYITTTTSSSGAYYSTNYMPSYTTAPVYWQRTIVQRPPPEPEIEPSPELDEFIGLFRKKQTQGPEAPHASE